MSNTVKILLVEDSEDDELLLRRELQKSGVKADLTRVITVQELRRELNQANWSIVISDYNIPGFTGLDALKIVREIHPELPFILVSGTVGEDVAVAAMKAGAQDYIMKGNMVRLAPAVTRELHESEERRKQREHLAEKEAELRQAQKMELMGQISGSLAHDFNNILSIIGLYTQQILARTTSSNEVQQNLKGITEAQQRGTHLVRQLFTLSRKQPTDFHTIDLNITIQNLADLMTMGLGRDHELILRLSPTPTYVYGDPNQIEQVLMNFILNARDAMTKHGQVTVKTEVRKPGKVFLIFSDTGCGIDDATVKKIFEPFFTTKDPGKGSGIGLATVAAIVKQHQGEISVASALGQGTTFTIKLPLKEGAI